MNAVIGQTTQEATAAAVADGLTEDTFFFRPKDVLDAEGKTVFVDGKKQTTKRAPFKARLPYTTQEALIALLQDETKAAKTLEFLIDLANDSIYEAAQGQVNALIADGKELVQEALDIAGLDLYALATKPKTVSVRGIPKEVWAAFKPDFISVLTKEFNVSIDGATKAAKLIADDRFQSVKTAPNILKILDAHLANWYSKTSEESKETFAEIYAESVKKIELYMNQGEQNFIDSIQ